MSFAAKEKKKGSKQNQDKQTHHTVLQKLSPELTPITLPITSRINLQFFLNFDPLPGVTPGLVSICKKKKKKTKQKICKSNQVNLKIIIIIFRNDNSATVLKCHFK